MLNSKTVSVKASLRHKLDHEEHVGVGTAVVRRSNLQQLATRETSSLRRCQPTPSKTPVREAKCVANERREVKGRSRVFGEAFADAPILAEGPPA